jgi:Mg-chelatase subunit ChlD
MVSQINTSRMCVIGCMAWLLWMSSPASASSSVQQPALRPVGPVHMVQREPGESTPFFRMELQIDAARQSPPSVAWPKDEKALRESLQIDVQGHGTVHPFYVDSPEATAEPRAVGREVLLVIDISGSMTQRLADGRSRFQAAKDAAGKFLHSFQNGVDHIAIVPFESHRVAERIKEARFVSTTAEARYQIEALPPPRGDYNTALYSATVAALEVLEGRKALRPPRQFQLIILTDGRNDVKRRDDPGLLDGNRGLQTVVLKAGEVRIPIYTVGFARPGELDEGSLRAMAWPDPSNYFPAPDADRLEEALQAPKVIRQASVDRLRLTFATAHREWSMLKGLTFVVRLQLPHGGWLESRAIPWFCTAMTGCPPEGTLTQAEVRALLDNGPVGEGRTYRGVVLRRLGLLVLFSGGLAALWFIPRRPRPSIPVGAHVGQPRFPTVPGKLSGALRPPAPERGHQSQPPRPRQRVEETAIFRDQDNGLHPGGSQATLLRRWPENP